MFRETLLESAPGARRRKRWPMILAVALEVTVCSLLIALPLFSTGIIPIAARSTDVPWIEPRPVVESRPVGHDGGRGPVMPSRPIIQIADGRPIIRFGHPASPGDYDPTLPPNIGALPTGQGMPMCDACVSTPVGPPKRGPLVLSQGVTEGYLLRKVEPIYPRMAVLAGIHGEVRMHAIIAKDGTIQSLSLVSGHPLLARAAMDAVEQWRYRPYLLNHEPVEVETLITVNFTGAR